VAHGWESKSVEEQQSQAATPTEHRRSLTPGEQARQRRIEGLMLSRKRVLQELEAALNPRHRAVLQAALTELDAQLARLG